MNYDIVIVGGGLVGAALACALNQSNLKIALLDARKPTGDNDPRLFALSELSCNFLRNIGVWPSVAAHAAAINRIHVSCEKQFGVLKLSGKDIGLDHLGFVIPAYYLEDALLAKLASLANLTVYKPAKLTNLSFAVDQQHANLTVEIAENKLTQLNAAFVCAADGTHSTVRDLLDIKTKIIDYEQTAIVTRSLLATAHENIAYERFTKQGTIAMLPLIGNECGTVWSLPNGYAKSLMHMSDEEFVLQLQKTFGWRLGRIEKISPRYQYPLRMITAEKNHYENVILLGNACHTLHPIAAQGFNLALYEVALLAELILEKQQDNQKFTTEDLAQVSEKLCHQQRLAIKLSHALANLLTNYRNLSLRSLPFGFTFLNLMPKLKGQLLKQLLGLRASSPRLLLQE